MNVREFKSLFTELELSCLGLVITDPAEHVRWGVDFLASPKITEEAFTRVIDSLLANAYIDQSRYDELMLQCPTDTDPGSYAANP